MAFKLSQELTFRWPVKVIEPDPHTPGKLIEQEFTAHFAIIAPDRAKARDAERLALFEQVKPETEGQELRDINKRIEKHDFESLTDVLRGWDGVFDDYNNAIPFNPETVEIVCAHTRVKNALIRAYRESISEDKARLGNSN
ncbi:tail assembly chaperone [Rhizobium sp. SJZ105]|uniref:phage tail assembly chaperone n=1 Tax=Rhizobium sp. SJZ105 TaxID=2572678 RepID=UPI0011A4A4AC|nr:phage tail assembly chaperone [Rhizobium sp. SJZ105]TWC85657.1 tail assembly chaperone [Rhizobium sp. SJZ105]